MGILSISEVYKSFIITINYYITIIVKSLGERKKYLEALSGSLFRQPTSHRSWLVKNHPFTA
jgi:hypothetical protein